MSKLIFSFGPLGHIRAARLLMSVLGAKSEPRGTFSLTMRFIAVSGRV